MRKKKLKQFCWEEKTLEKNRWKILKNQLSLEINGKNPTYKNGLST